MNIVEKLDRYLNENVSQGSMIKKLGLTIGMGLWHYLIGKTDAVIFQSKGNNSKRLIDELWFRIGKSTEDSEQVTDAGIKKIKKDFYSFEKEFKDWKFDKNSWIKQ